MNKRTNTAVLLLYVCFFLALFVQFPLKGSLPGSIDTWLFISLFNTMGNDLISFITDANSGSSLFPVKNIYLYGETAFGLGAIFLFFKSIFHNDIIVYYLTISSVFNLTAFAAYKVSSLFINNFWGALFSSFCFTCSGFMLGNMDSIQTVFYFPFLLSIYFFIKFLRSKDSSYIYKSFIIGAIQVYCSAYIFLFQCLTIGLLIIFHVRQQANLTLYIKPFVKATLLFLFLTLPFFGFYLHKMQKPDFFDPYHRLLLSETQSLNPPDLTRALPNNLLYDYAPLTTEKIFKLTRLLITYDPTLRFYTNTAEKRLAYGTLPEINEEMVFLSTKTCASMGILIVLLAFIGFMSVKSYRWFLFTLGFGGFILALGPAIIINETALPAPLLPLYQGNIIGLFRVPCRAYALTTLTIAIFAGRGSVFLLKKFNYSKRLNYLLLPVLFTAFSLENIPMPFRAFEASIYTKPYEEYDQFVKTIAKDNIILNLPSSPGAGLAHSYENLTEWGRECIYMNWQTYHKTYILNGVNGYFPLSRIKIQGAIEKLPKSQAFVDINKLITPHKLDYIVFHKWLMLDFAKDSVRRSEYDLFMDLCNSPDLKIIKETEKVAIFKLLNN